MSDSSSPQPPAAWKPSGESPVAALEWLADAPLFIDSEQVSAFYDAVVRPETREGRITLSLERLQGHKTEVKGSLTGELAVSDWLKTFLPFLDMKLKGEAAAGREVSEDTKEANTIDLYPIETPHRQLIQLTLHYLTNLPERIRLVTQPLDKDWRRDSFIGLLPRALVFIDFPPGTKFIPMAAEVDKGHVVLMFEKLETETEKPPRAPQLQHSRVPDAVQSVSRQEWASYWSWFDGHFDPLVAMGVVERVVGEGGQLQWIDYRVPLEASEIPLHLHVVGRGRFSTGNFAFQTITRGYQHGLRMVGTLKSEPDMNVLAIFEK